MLSIVDVVEVHDSLDSSRRVGHAVRPTGRQHVSSVQAAEQIMGALCGPRPPLSSLRIEGYDLRTTTVVNALKTLTAALNAHRYTITGLGAWSLCTQLLERRQAKIHDAPLRTAIRSA